MSKGATWERKFSKELSLWYSYGKDEDLFWRSGGSGSRFTNKAKKGNVLDNSSGDISSLKKEGFSLTDNVHFELKAGYSGKKKLKKNAVSDIITYIMNSPKEDTEDCEKKLKNFITTIKTTHGRKVSLTDLVDNPAHQKETLLEEWWEKADREADHAKKLVTCVIYKRDSKQPCVVFDSSMYEFFDQQINRKLGIFNNSAIITTKQGSEFLILSLEKFFEIIDPEIFVEYITKHHIANRKYLKLIKKVKS